MELKYDNEIKQGHVCYLSAMANIMNYFSYHVSEYDLLIPITGLDIIINRDEDGIDIRCSDVRVDEQKYISFFNYIGFNFETICRKDNYSIEFIESQINNSIPVIACVDVYKLSYHPEYSKKHALHIVAIFGIDKKRHEVLVLDSDVTTIAKSTFYGWIKYDEWDFIMDLNKCNISFRNLYWVLEPNTRNFKYFNENTKFEILRYSAIKFLFYSDANYGITAISSLREYINKFKNCVFFNSNRDELYNLYIMLTSQCGPVATRKLISLFLENIESIFKISSILIQGYKDLSHDWLITAKLILKTLIKYNMTQIKHISDRLDAIQKKENNLARLIIESSEKRRM